VSEPRTLDLVVVAVYLLGTVGLGMRFLRRSGTTEGFTVGSRSIPAWAVGLSVLGVFVSSLSFVGNPGKAYTDNWAPFLFALTVPLVALIAGRVFIPLYRKRREVSAYSYLEERFGFWARGYGSLSFQLIQFGRVSVILYLVALVVAPILGLSIPTVIVVVGILVTIYTMAGGIEAVIWTDVIQVIVMFGGALWCLVLIFKLMPGGPAEIFRVALEAGGKFDLGEMSFRWDNQTFVGVLLFGILSNLQNFGVDQNYIQRYHTAKSEQEARKALLIAVLPFIPVTALFLMIGTSLFSFYRVQPGLLPDNVTGDMVFPHFIATQLPPGVAGLLIAAILAAAMSTISSSLNCMATVFVEDIYCRGWKRRLTDRQHVRLLRLLTALCGVGGMGLAVAMVGNRSGLDLFWEICALVGSGLLGIFLLGVLPLSITRRAVQWATAATVIFVLWGTFSREASFLPAQWQCHLDRLLVGALGTGLLMGAGIFLSRVLPDRPEEEAAPPEQHP